MICGGRDFLDDEFILDRFLHVHARMEFTTVITGGARGADTIGNAIGEALGLETRVFPADWNRHGKAAGGIRNAQMLTEGRPDYVMAFPGGPGTANMIRQSLAARVPVWRSDPITFNSKVTKYAFLSNFASGFEFVDSDGCVWATSEHFYQSRKTSDEALRGLVQRCKLPDDAKQQAKGFRLVEGWEPRQGRFGGIKEQAMREALAYKFAEGSEAAKKLLKTRSDYLVEHSPYGDLYWGTNGSNGLNRLGVLLMERRNLLDIA